MRTTNIFRILIVISFIFLSNFAYSSKVYPKHFINIMKSVLIFEGGFSDILDDPGGATHYGITQKTYNVYNSKKGLPQKSVRYITLDEVYDCYYRYYYLPAGCDTLTPGLSFVHFDSAVNFGLAGSKKLLLKTFLNEKLPSLSSKQVSNLDSLIQISQISQSDSLNISAQRIISRIDTIDKHLAFKYVEIRKARRYEIVKYNEKKRKFLRGWLNRDEKVRKIIEQYY